MSEHHEYISSPEELKVFVEKVERLKDEGLNMTVISTRLGLSKRTIQDRLNRHKKHRSVA